MTELIEAPIVWSRNSALQEVPKEVSINADVSARWNKINRTIFDGIPVEPDIKSVDEALSARNALIIAEALDPRFDWKHDFELSRYAHRFHLANLDYVRNKRTSYIEYWRSWALDAAKYFHELSLSGQKTIYLMHGAIALGAINILTDPKKAATLALTAKVAVIFSAIGVVLAGAGQLTSFYFGSLFTARIRGKLVGDLKWSKARAIARYMKRYGVFVAWGDRAIYGSVIWFGVYVLILLVFLLSS